MLATGGLLPAAVALLGLVLRHDLSPVLGWGTLAVGTAGIAGALVAAATPPSALVAVGILGPLAFHLIPGIGGLRLSRR